MLELTTHRETLRDAYVTLGQVVNAVIAPLYERPHPCCPVAKVRGERVPLRTLAIEKVVNEFYLHAACVLIYTQRRQRHEVKHLASRVERSKSDASSACATLSRLNFDSVLRQKFAPPSSSQRLTIMIDTCTSSPLKSRFSDAQSSRRTPKEGSLQKRRRTHLTDSYERTGQRERIA